MTENNKSTMATKFCVTALLVACISIGVAGYSYTTADNASKDLAQAQKANTTLKKNFDKKIDELSARTAANDNKINQAAKDANQAVKDNSQQSKDIVELKK